MLFLKTFCLFKIFIPVCLSQASYKHRGEGDSERFSSPSKERHNVTCPLVTRHNVTGYLEHKNSEYLQ